MNYIKLRQARDLIVEAFREHEAACQSPRCPEKANVLAWLAHALGATRDDLRQMEPLVVWNDFNCSCRRCLRADQPLAPEKLHDKSARN